MDYQGIIQLMKEMDQSSITRLDLQIGDMKLFLSKEDISSVSLSQGTDKISENHMAQANHEVIKLQSRNETLEIQSSSERTSHEVTLNANDKTRVVTSPMVGTYYGASSPDQPPYVKVGDRVAVGQTLCILEAMKLMNEIEAEFAGVVEEILVKNEEMVEYGKPLFRIREE